MAGLETLEPLLWVGYTGSPRSPNQLELRPNLKNRRSQTLWGHGCGQIHVQPCPNMPSGEVLTYLQALVGRRGTSSDGVRIIIKLFRKMDN